MNIEEILRKYAKEGDKFYSPVYGEVEFLQCCKDYKLPIRVLDATGDMHMFSPAGCIHPKFNDSECVLFPAVDQRDWNQYLQEHEGVFKVGDHVICGGEQYYVSDVLEDSDDENNICIVPVIYQRCAAAWVSPNEIKRCDHFDPKTLQPYDKIIGWNESMGAWAIDYFQFIAGASERKYVGMTNNYYWVIPYNAETRFLLGTEEHSPNFYADNEN